MSTDPTKPFRSAQFEFTEEHGRTIGALADAMRTVATPLQLLGMALAILAGLQAVTAANGAGGYAPVAGLAAAAVLVLAFGFWTGAAAASFRKVVETRNEDVWHLMNALGKLRGMYGTLQAFVYGALVLAVVGLTLAVAAMANKG
jgi:hypothetical protein